MKVLLFVFSLVNLQLNLQASPLEDVFVPGPPNFDLSEEAGGCQVDFHKLEGDIKAIKQILQEKESEFATENLITSDKNLKQIASDIDDLKTRFLKLLATNNDVDLVDLIKSNDRFINKKLLSLSIDVSELVDKFNIQNDKTNEPYEKHEAMFAQINKNVNEMLQNFNGAQLTINQFSKENAYLSKKFEEFHESVLQILDTKFKQQENELKTLKAQNTQFLTQLKQLNERLDQHDVTEHVENVVGTVAEKHENFTNDAEEMHATLLKHISVHMEYLNNKHESSRKDIEREIAKLDSKSITDCGNFDTNKQILETLIARFDKAEPLWKKLDNLTETQNNCSDLTGEITIELS